MQWCFQYITCYVSSFHLLEGLYYVNAFSYYFKNVNLKQTDSLQGYHGDLTEI